MLKKLIKHEFRATSKAMWPIFGGLIILALLSRFAAIPLLNKNINFLFNAVAILVLIGFSIGTAILGFAPLLVSGSRFKKSVLGQEGYLTNALPVSSFQIVGSKLITNAAWYAMTGIMLIAICFVMLGSFSSIENVPAVFRGLFRAITQIEKDDASKLIHFGICVLEGLIDMVAGVSLLTVMVYASYSIGYSAKKRKSLWTVLLIYGFFHVLCWIGVASLMYFGREDIRYTDAISSFKAVEGFLGCEFVLILVLGIVFYFITNHFITKKLNLE